LLNRDNIKGKPLIQFNYLEHPDDMREMLEGVKKARELFSQPVFDEFRGNETTPGSHIQTDEELVKSIRQITETDYHPCGTCRMGYDRMAVVDSELRVHGVEGLRVVDASVMPKVTSANLNAPTQMIAARAADYILGKQQMSPLHARFSFQ
jgi:choline dehydrogenase